MTVSRSKIVTSVHSNLEKIKEENENCCYTFHRMRKRHTSVVMYVQILPNEKVLCILVCFIYLKHELREFIIPTTLSVNFSASVMHKIIFTFLFRQRTFLVHVMYMSSYCSINVMA